MFKFLLKNKLKTLEELDSLYEIIDDHNSWVEIRVRGDTSYWNEKKSFKAYKFTDGVNEFCIKCKIRLCFTPQDKSYPDLKSIYHCMKNMGCCDLILDTLIDTAKSPDKKYKQKNRSYDVSGKLIKKNKGFFLI